MFQPTYLYKIRRINALICPLANSFNPRTSIRYDRMMSVRTNVLWCFNPRTSIRYDIGRRVLTFAECRFNPRTSIRYDVAIPNEYNTIEVSTHVPL